MKDGDNHNDEEEEGDENNLKLTIKNDLNMDTEAAEVQKKEIGKSDHDESFVSDSMISEDGLDEEAMDTLLSASIRESLSAKNNEVREAAHRLLRNRMIEVDRISERSESLSGSASSRKTPDTGDQVSSEYAAMKPMGGALDSNDDIQEDETTSLLVKSGDDTKSMGAMNNFG